MINQSTRVARTFGSLRHNDRFYRHEPSQVPWVKLDNTQAWPVIGHAPGTFTFRPTEEVWVDASPAEDCQHTVDPNNYPPTTCHFCGEQKDAEHIWSSFSTVCICEDCVAQMHEGVQELKAAGQS